MPYDAHVSFHGVSIQPARVSRLKIHSGVDFGYSKFSLWLFPEESLWGICLRENILK
jgi:hypothetical protein